MMAVRATLGSILLCAALASLSAQAETEALKLSLATSQELTDAGTITGRALAASAADLLPTLEVDSPARLPDTLDLTAPTDDLWERMRRGFAMPELDDPLVTKHMKWYLDRPEYVRRMVERSRRYMHFIVEEIERRGLPTELALLPMVESAFNPLAYSRAKASGLWQFIPSTGKMYDLDQNWWVDERRDVVSSTNAALGYLQRIYEMHGDWHLALASYNWGEGSVGRAIVKNRNKGLPTDYLSLTMPPETRNYVPKLQALKNILADRNLASMLELPAIPNERYFATIVKPAAIDVHLAAKLAGVPLNEFVALNPAHNRPVIRSDIPLLLPADKIDTFQANLEAYEGPLSSWRNYVFQKGDRLDKVAAKHGMTLAQLKSVNGLTGKRSRAIPGQSLLVLAGPAGRENLAVISHMPNTPVFETPAKGRRVVAKRGGPVRLAAAKGTTRSVAAKGGRKMVAKNVRAGTTKKVAARPVKVVKVSLNRAPAGNKPRGG